MKRLLACSVIVIVAATLVQDSAAAGGKINSSLRFMRHMRESAPGPSAAREMLGAAVTQERVAATVKFDHVLTAAEIADYERTGVSFYYLDGEVARTRAIYPVRVPWDAIDLIAGRTEVLRLEGNWNPVVLPLLDVSRHEIEADSAWAHVDPLGNPLTGKGTRIADFDTGIDVFHPSFFLADGDTFDWINTSGMGIFFPGYDHVDLNRNGTADAGELLDYWDGWIYDPAHTWGPSNPNNTGGYCDTYWDWIFNDANGNGDRDYGTGAGFTESDPTFGEQVFVALDDDNDGVLDIGEKLVALGTSKIYAAMTADSTERLRGVDLILTEEDTNGHGTAVCGVAAGGTAGRHRFCGIAPEAELLPGYFFSDLPIAFLVPWARSRGADVMLYEFGGFIWRPLDGSSLDEEIVSIENETIIQITPSGNLGRGDKHAIATVPAYGSLTFRVDVPVYGGTPIQYWYSTALWTTSEGDLTFKLRSALGGEITLDGTTWFVDGYYIWHDRSTSPRGTCELDLYIDSYTNSDVVGLWRIIVENNTGEGIEVICNVADHLSSWADGAEHLDYATDQRNVTWPATCDSAFCNGSYSTRGFEGYEGVGGGSIPAGEISAFSGRGVRIDGKHLLDICSPGNYDVYSARTHQDGAGYPAGSYRQFSGTSAAGPHVAAAAAIVQQRWPAATMPEVELLLASHAASDAYTGAVYNDTWGWGKLRILGAIGAATAVEDIELGKAPPRLVLDQNYPNPFNPSTWIPFYIPADGRVRIAIYNIKGELVRMLRDRPMEAGAHSVYWDGRDGAGRDVASGVYFCSLEHGGLAQTRKLVLLR